MSDTLSVELPLKPESASWAREALAEFRGYLDRASYIDVQLMLSELVSDAVLTNSDDGHAITVQIEVRLDRLHLSVLEGNFAYELSSSRPDAGERGWGIYLTRTLAEWWGTRHEDGRACVWFQMPIAAT